MRSMMLRNVATVCGAAVLVCGFGANAALAQVIDFNTLTFPGGSVETLSDLYTEDGFTLTETGFATFSVWETESPNYLGTPALFIDTPNGTATLTKSDAGLFDLTSIDLSELFDGGAAVTVEFTGTKADLSTVSSTFTTDGVFGLETFAFGAPFTGLIRVVWTQEDPFHQFDNIVLNGAGAAAPEPGALALLLPVVGAVIAAKRRRTV